MGGKKVPKLVGTPPCEGVEVQHSLSLLDSLLDSNMELRSFMLP